jgi:hypothetical protein
MQQYVKHWESNLVPQPAGSSRTIPWAAAFMAGTLAGPVGTHQGKIIDKAKVKRLLAQGLKIHESELPAPPTSQHGVDTHILRDQWIKAELEHLESHRQMKSWTKVPVRRARETGKQILDCMWVYTYKLNKEGHMIKCKARIVVRGDQQRNITTQDTYAATLASQSFQLLMTIAARYDLELTQHDVTNAFVHATMDREIYMRMPPGHREPGTILQVDKALYGLRISPLLWQKDFTSTLLKLGFTLVPHEPCCATKDGVIIFFYVDDIVMAYPKEKSKQAAQLLKDLQKNYTITGGHNLQWFLGMEVIRDRSNKRLQLSQASYLEKISRLIDRKELRHDTPMMQLELKPREGLASPGDIKKYQRKIGSILYAAITTRPDVAFAVSRLARFMLNPGPEHHDAADRVLLYLLSSKNLALAFGDGDDLEVASDASFADNTLDRKSSQGYTIRLFGGLISWKASKQDTVTTFTTEAELLALSQAAKEAMFASRLIQELNVMLPNSTITILCDNLQTINLVTKDAMKLQTKLRHVDIHNHWLRQEVKNKTIKVKYVQSQDMPADGFTKVLPASKWPGFLNQIGLIARTDTNALPPLHLNAVEEALMKLVT